MWEAAILIQVVLLTLKYHMCHYQYDDDGMSRDLMQVVYSQ